METCHYSNTPEYINQLAFDYFETYSFQRGEVYEEQHQNLRAEYESLKVRHEKRNSLTEEEKNRLAEMAAMLTRQQYLIREDGTFHYSSRKVNTFSINDFAAKKLIEILSTPVAKVPDWMCGPVYRDAIVFYRNPGEIISVLNICLSCWYMETKPFHHLNGDERTYLC